MTLGILAAMEEEISLVTEMIEAPVHTELGGRVFVQGKINGIDCVAVFSKWGKVAAAITATLLIEHFHIDKLIFIGTAGALSDKLNVGDIVVSRRLVQHDLDARPIIPRFQIPLTDKSYIDSDRQLSELAVKSVNKRYRKILQRLSEWKSKGNSASLNLYFGRETLPVVTSLSTVMKSATNLYPCYRRCWV